MNLRIESLVLTPDAFFLPFALAYFTMLAWRGLLGAHGGVRRPALEGIVCAILGGILGGWLYGQVGPDADSGVLGLPEGDWRLRFGSIGGYWGVLAGAGFHGWLRAGRGWDAAGAVTPGLLAGGAVARIGCLFAGCCRGVGWPGRFRIFHLWPLYDMAAMLIALLAIRYLKRRVGASAYAGSLLLYLVGYGVVRFLIEFARDAPFIRTPFTFGHAMAAAQVVVGGILWAWWRFRSQKT